MAQNHPTAPDGESSNSFAMRKSLEAYLSAPIQPPYAMANPYGSIANRQQHNSSSMMDPNFMMMTNAAATFQHLNQAKAAPPHTSAQYNYAAALNARNSLLSHPHHANVGSASLGASSAPQNSLYAGPASSLQQFLGFGDRNKTSAAQHQSAPALSSATASNTMLPSMQTWSLEKLGKKEKRWTRYIFQHCFTFSAHQYLLFTEQRVNLMQQLNQPVPQYLALLLAEARRKHKKKNSKRLANRKSASTSRARKKALVEEMTRTNARLKRQALILSLIPDVVVAISSDGEITFCNAQAERVLHHKVDDLIGAKLSDLLVPASREALSTLVKGLASAEKNKASGHGTKNCVAEKRDSSADRAESKVEVAKRNRNSDDSAAIVSELSFPSPVIDVYSKQLARPSAEINAEQNDNSDTSMSNSNGKAQISSLTNGTSSPSVSSGDEKAAGQGGSRGSTERSTNGKRLVNCDSTSSLSSDAKNMSKANENLERNVRWHNQRMMGTSVNSENYGPKDDVTGASVTANNATARLSSLIHVPDHSKRKEDKSSRYQINGDQSSSDESLLAGVEEKKKAGENASDDSGYRESNDSRQESSSPGSDTSNSNGECFSFIVFAFKLLSCPILIASLFAKTGQQKKPLTAACRMCLIRLDLTTVWCEVTSSIGTRLVEVDSPDFLSASKSGAPSEDTPVAVKEEVMELLLCIRPIRDGEKKVDESLRFVAPKSVEQVDAEGLVVSSSGDPNMPESSSGSGIVSNQDGPRRPLKKRPPQTPVEEASQQKKMKQKTDGTNTTSCDTEKGVVESLMLMNKSSQ
jgi:PAS domain-containing protein